MNNFLLSSAVALIVMATAAPAQLSGAAGASGSANRDGGNSSATRSGHSPNDSVLQGVNSNARIFGDDSNRRIDTSAISSTFGGTAKPLHDPKGSIAVTTQSNAHRGRSPGDPTVSIVAKNATISARQAGSASGRAGRLALAGSAAARAPGTFDVAPGMVVREARGAVIGRVQTIRSTASGRIIAIRMRVGRATLSLPASNFRGSGNVLISSMGKAQVNRAARRAKLN